MNGNEAQNGIGRGAEVTSCQCRCRRFPLPDLMLHIRLSDICTPPRACVAPLSLLQKDLSVETAALSQRASGFALCIESSSNKMSSTWRVSHVNADSDGTASALPRSPYSLGVSVAVVSFVVYLFIHYANIKRVRPYVGRFGP